MQLTPMVHCVVARKRAGRKRYINGRPRSTGGLAWHQWAIWPSGLMPWRCCLTAWRSSKAPMVRSNTGCRQCGATSDNGTSTKARRCMSGWGSRNCPSRLRPCRCQPIMAPASITSRSKGRGPQRGPRRRPASRSNRFNPRSNAAGPTSRRAHTTALTKSACRGPPIGLVMKLSDTTFTCNPIVDSLRIAVARA